MFLPKSLCVGSLFPLSPPLQPQLLFKISSYFSYPPPKFCEQARRRLGAFPPLKPLKNSSSTGKTLGAELGAELIHGENARCGARCGLGAELIHGENTRCGLGAELGADSVRSSSTGKTLGAVRPGSLKHRKLRGAVRPGSAPRSFSPFKSTQKQLIHGENARCGARCGAHPRGKRSVRSSVRTRCGAHPRGKHSVRTRCGARCGLGAELIHGENTRCGKAGVAKTS